MSGINDMILSGRLSSWWKRGISNLSTGSIIHKRQICLKSSVILTLNMHTHTYTCIFYVHVIITYVYITSRTRNVYSCVRVCVCVFFFAHCFRHAQVVYKRSSMIVVTNEITCSKYTCIEDTRQTTFYALYLVSNKTIFVHTGLCFFTRVSFPANINRIYAVLVADTVMNIQAAISCRLKNASSPYD